jgi:hypothetical protein
VRFLVDYLVFPRFFNNPSGPARRHSVPVSVPCPFSRAASTATGGRGLVGGAIAPATRRRQVDASGPQVRQAPRSINQHFSRCPTPVPCSVLLCDTIYSGLVAARVLSLGRRRFVGRRSAPGVGRNANSGHSSSQQENLIASSIETEPVRRSAGASEGKVFTCATTQGV